MSTRPPPHVDLAADAALWARLRAGDRGALTALYRDSGGRLLRFLDRLCGSRTLAEDVLQDVFLAVLDDAGGARGTGADGGFDPARGSLRSYMFGMARNAGLRRLRGQRPPPAEAPPASTMVAARQDDEQAVRSALGRLDAIFREVVLLCDLEGLSYEEAAVALAIPVGTVRSRLARARARLVDQLGDEVATDLPAVREGGTSR